MNLPIALSDCHCPDPDDCLYGGPACPAGERRKLAKVKRVLLRDVKSAEHSYASAQQTWGDNNMVTQRAMAKWYELRASYEAQTRDKS